MDSNFPVISFSYDDEYLLTTEPINCLWVIDVHQLLANVDRDSCDSCNYFCNNIDWIWPHNNWNVIEFCCYHSSILLALTNFLLEHYGKDISCYFCMINHFWTLIIVWENKRIFGLFYPKASSSTLLFVTKCIFAFISSAESGVINGEAWLIEFFRVIHESMKLFRAAFDLVNISVVLIEPRIEMAFISVSLKVGIGSQLAIISRK